MSGTSETQAAQAVGHPLAHPSKGVLRFNGALTVILLGVVAVLVNVAAGRFLSHRVDFSEDGLYSLSAATQSIVGRIEDRVTVRMFATEDVGDGQLALRSARIKSQLEEILGLRPNSFELQVLDPSRSTEALMRAREKSFSPRRGARGGLGGGSGEAVWLSFELGYRGRSEIIAEPQPWQFEVQFAQALHGLLSDRRVGVGWWGSPVDANGDTEDELNLANTYSTFRTVRRIFQQRGAFIEVLGLETGRGVPDEVDVLFVVRPGQVHERAAYAIDQFVQRGGKLIVCLEGRDYSAFTGTAASTVDSEASPLTRLLGSWGIAVLPAHIWDREWMSPRYAFQAQGLPIWIQSPLVLTVPEEGLEASLPPTQGLKSVQFSWAQPLAPESRIRTPKGVTRTDLVRSSKRAWIYPSSVQLAREPRSVRTQLSDLQRTKKPAQFQLAAVFAGRFPSLWADADPPEPAEDPLGFGPDLSAEAAPLSQASDSTVVVFGDADWLRDPFTPNKAEYRFIQGGGGLLALNLVDWLTLDEELIGLRSRAPTMRPLRDFVLEEEGKLNVYVVDPNTTELERVKRNANRDKARARARRAQWLTMLIPALGALLIVGAFGILWNVLGARAAASSSARGSSSATGSNGAMGGDGA